MRKGTLNACVLKGDRLNGDDDREEVKLNALVGSLLRAGSHHSQKPKLAHAKTAKNLKPQTEVPKN